MIIPDNLLLEKITKQHLYRDKKSKESSTNRVKPKYKLAGNQLLENFFFHVLTRNKEACKQVCTADIYLEDWENIAGGFRLAEVCYCDLTKFEIIERPNLLKKMKDRKNGFPYVAKLANDKYRRLLKLRKSLSKHPRISEETKHIVEEGISPTIDRLLSKLDLD